MPVAAHFLQITVLNYAYNDFIDTVASYFKGAQEDGLEDFLIYEAYVIFQDRWPHNKCSKSGFIAKVVEASSRMNPITIGPKNHWMDVFDLKKDRHARLSLQAYASRLGLGTFTFPEPAPLTSANDNEGDEADDSSSDGEGTDDDSSNTGEDSKDASGDGSESDVDIIVLKEFRKLPTIRRVVKLERVTESS